LNASDINREIADLAFEILCDEWSFNTPIRMLTVSVSGLVDSASSFTQLDLFSTVDADARDREKRREETVDTPYGPIRRKISTGYSVQRSKWEYEDIARIAKEKNLSIQQVLTNIE
jgi:hypothetical protein